MANNIPITAGSGTNVSTDQITSDSSHAQLIKLLISAAGDRTPIPATAANGLTVDVTRVQGVVTVTPNSGAVFHVDDNSSTLSVDDGGGSLTVDAPAATPIAVRLSTGAAFIDTIPVSGSVTAAQGAPAAAANRWLVQHHDGTTAATVDAGTGGLKVYIAGGSAGGGIALADKAAFTEGTTTFNPVGGEFIAAPSDPSDGHVAVARITVKRALHINLRDNSGAELGTSGNALRVDVTGATTQPVSGTITAKLKDDGGTAYSPSNPLYVTRGGRARARVTKSVALAASQTDQAVWTPAGGKTFYIEKIVLVVTTAGPLILFDQTNAAGNTIADSGSGVNWPTGVYTLDFAEPWASATVDNVLKYTSGSGLVAKITLHGFEV